MYDNITNSYAKHSLDNSSVVYSITLSSTILLALFSPVAVTGNALVCAAIWRNPSLRTPSYILLAGLAVADFCTGLIVQPILVANRLIYLTGHQINLTDKNSWSAAFSITRAISRGFSMYFFEVTILIVTLMSIERWLHMTRRPWITVGRTYLTVLLLLLIPIPLAMAYVQDSSKYVTGVGTFSILFFCLSVTSVSYFKVFRLIRRHQQQIHANELCQNFAQPAINIEKYKKSVYTILYILAVFNITYLPTVISMVLVVVLESISFISVIIIISTIFVHLSSLLNPLLYLWRMNDIRNEVRHLVKRIFCCGS